MKTNRNLRPNHAKDQKVEGNRPPFIFKKIRVCFLQLFDPSTPKASNCDPNSRENFKRNYSYENSFKQCNISHNLIKFCRIWEFKVSTELLDPKPLPQSIHPVGVSIIIVKISV